MHAVTATTTPGLEPVLQRELEDAGAAHTDLLGPGEVTFHVHHPDEARGLVHQVRTLRRLHLPGGTTVPPEGERSLDHRGYGRHGHGGATRSTVAAAMLRVAGWHEAPQDAVMADPFCGGGTMGIEAAWMRHDVPPTALREEPAPPVSAAEPHVVLGDLDPHHVEGARGNAEAAGALDAVVTYAGDVATLPKHVDGPVACIVTDPPFRGGLVDPGPAEEAIAALFHVAAKLLEPSGCLVLRNPRAGLVKACARTAGLAVEEALRVTYGTLEVPVWVAGATPMAEKGPL